MNALIGYTGFIGSTILENRLNEPIHLYRSTNISQITNYEYDIVFCAGISATKWKANKNPDEDWTIIHNLLQILERVKCNRFILISTISVYDTEPYGRHRKMVEDRLRLVFKNRLQIVRLPACYGKNFKKNILFDLLNQSKLIKRLNLEDKFQWFNVDHVNTYINDIIKTDIIVLELFPEPISNRELLSTIPPSLTKDIDLYVDTTSAYTQDVKPNKKYIYNKKDVIDNLTEFITYWTKYKNLEK